MTHLGLAAVDFPAATRGAKERVRTQEYLD